MRGKSKQVNMFQLLRDEVEAASEYVSAKIASNNEESKLDILTLIGLLEKRVDSKKIRAVEPEEEQYTDKDYLFVHNCVVRAERMSNDLTGFFSSSAVESCLDASLKGEKDKEGFQSVKEEWRNHRKTIMLTIKVNDEIMLRNFVFLECLGRMMLIWHEEQNEEITKKNLKLVDHLLFKYDMNAKLSGYPKVIRLMNMLGELYDNTNLKNRLKLECQPKPSAYEEIDDELPNFVVKPIPPVLELQALNPPRSIEQNQDRMNQRPSSEITLNVPGGHLAIDATFLSEKSDSSISFFDNEDKKQRSSGAKKKQSEAPSSEKKPYLITSSERQVQVDSDVREITRDKLYSRLVVLIGDSKAVITANNIEARLFGIHYNDEHAYDAKYSKLISFLESLLLSPSLISPLIDSCFDLDFMLSRCENPRRREDGTLGKRSMEKTTQTFEFEAFPNIEKRSREKQGSVEKMMVVMRESDTQYLHMLIKTMREETEYLKKMVFDLRLKQSIAYDEK